jgi:leader peptidase (prepilin peptidase)/N-methyltransferase
MDMQLLIAVLKCAVAFVLGSVVGSFLNVVILRLPRGMNFVSDRSECFTCHHKLNAADMIPLFSWIFLRGRCRYCKAKVSPRYIVGEAVTASLFLLCAFCSQTIWQFMFSAVLCAFLVVLSGTDIDTMEMPFPVLLAVVALGVVQFVSVFFAPGMFITAETLWHEHLIGLLIGAVPFGVLAVLGMQGSGDAWLMAGAGLILGFGVIPALFVALICGSVFGLIYKIVTKQSKMFFSPFLSVGIVFGCFWGDFFIDAYARLLAG